MSDRDSADLNQLRRIDSICEQVERGWRDGGRPAIEDVLRTCQPEDRPALLVELLQIEWDHRKRKGERVEIGEYAARFAGDVGAVEKAWALAKSHDTTADAVSPDTVAPAPEPTRRPDVHDTASGAALPAGYEGMLPIGEGGMGAVFKAFDPRLRRWVALKTLRFPRADLLSRFRTEAEAVARMAHPNVVQVYAFEQLQGEPCLVMEFVAGGSLEDRLGRSPLAWAEAAKLVAILARAVQAAHAAGVVHRDLKPANVLMASAIEGGAGNVLGGVPKISDFGLARLADDQGQTGTGQVLGTPHYMSPEQALGKTNLIGPPTDVWALGVMLYRCLTGALPFAADSVLETLDKVRIEEPTPPGDMDVAVPAEVEAVCLRCMAKDPAQRPTTGELAAELESLAGLEQRPPSQTGTGMDVVARPVAQKTPKARRRAGCQVTVAVTFACLFVAVGTWGVMNYQNQEVLRNADDEGKKDKGKEKEAAVPQLREFRVLHYAGRPGDKVEYMGVMGEKSKEAAFADQVRIEVKFREPARAYLIAFNANGTEQLLWPMDAKGEPDESSAPPAVAGFEYGRAKDDVLNLDDEPAGGMQAFAVVASSGPLPPYAEWKAKRGAAAWKRMAAEKDVWWCHDLGVVPWDQGDPVRRATAGKMKGVPDLKPLRASLLREGAEAVEVIAFGVRAKGGK